MCEIMWLNVVRVSVLCVSELLGNILGLVGGVLGVLVFGFM